MVSTEQTLAWSRELAEPALRTAVGTLPVSMRRIAGYHLGWWDRHGTHVPSGGSGKALRPTLVLLSSAAVGGTPRDAVPAAVAVELVHNFSLLHDDVMDGDLTRRHRPTAWSVFGIGSAILAGDALLTLALDVLAASSHPAAGAAMRTLSAAVQDLVEGQCTDMDFEQRSTVDILECENMVAGKTAALIGASCALGAMFGQASQDRVGHLRAFGEQLGLAFQHVDDLLGIWGRPETTGKPVFSDLRNRKKSLPVVAALASDSPAGRELAGLYARTAPLTDDELPHVADLVERAGGREWSRSQADDLMARAVARLDELGQANPVAAELTDMARRLTRRDH
ncbi:family 2 encapsulin nanocompartment cargo protein polyprenyl transferase [Actinophytocola oryzae]|uniref:family 2 encapsulin nanocompartment cargo protein polyprenyl transferase n=1 Tax=Actinophytocola oryzae TaxID=502181 RepID=UPI001FBB2EF5|nr:family 2 encapsulin nanocompartment cargo protein polyprenyl transferase [Actinophytocola oryzae]